MSLTPAAMLALFVAMAALAAAPSVSVLTVTARAASAGFARGAATALGVVAGDLVFILLALTGLALLAEALGDLFFLLGYLGGAYLIVLGVVLWRSAARRRGDAREVSGASSFLAGLLVTLGDHKAILFYLGFLPAFVDLSALSGLDIGAVMAIAVIAVGGVKLVYAHAAARAGFALGGRLGGILNHVAAGVMIGVGTFLLARA